MTTIDRKVVEARFDNKGFGKGVEDTLNSAKKLEQGLKFDGATKGLTEIDSAVKDLGDKGLQQGLGTGIAAVSQKFKALQIIGISALATIASKATSVGLNLAKNLSFQLPREGFAEYELKLGSIQTIMAGSGADLATVNTKLNELNTYADRTIYSFADMTQNIGKFTNAGVDLDQSVASIQGIANVAAVSGANANEASRAMYNFAQALSKGYVQLIDWKSIELANMGTVEFKTQLLEAAEAQGTLTKQGEDWVTETGMIVSATKNFNDSLTDQWLTTEVLNDTLGDYADETTEIGKKAFAAAQDVKTFTQLIDTVKEAIGSGWAGTFEILIGNFDEAKELFTNINNVISAWVDNSADARNKILGDWKKLGGRTVLIRAIGDIFENLGRLVGRIKEAFRDIFPATTGRQLYLLTTGFFNMVQSFKLGTDELNKLRRTFRGIFAAFNIGIEIIKGLGGFFADVFGEIFEGSGSFLNLTARIGDFLVKLNEAVTAGNGIEVFFEGLSSAIGKPIAAIKTFVASMLGLVDIDLPSFETIIETLRPLASIGEAVATAWHMVTWAFKEAWDFIAPLASNVGGAITSFGDMLSDFFSDIEIDWGLVFSGINTGLFAAVVGMLRNYISGKKEGGSGGGLSGLIEKVTEPFGQLTETLSTMQNTLRATTLLQIAAAVGIMSVSLIGLSKVDAENLKKALLAMTGLFVQLFASLAAFQVVGGAKGLSAAGLGLILLATAIRILVSSVQALGSMDVEVVKQGMLTLAGLLTMVIVTARLMSGATSGMFTAGAGLLLIAAAIKVLASAVGDFAAMSWEEIQRGLAAVGGILLGLAIFTRLADANKGGLAQGAGLLLIAFAIRVLADAVVEFSAMSWEEIGKGLAAVGGILTAFSIFSKIVSTGGIVKAGASLLIISAAMLVLAEATGKFAQYSWEELGKGMAAMAASLIAIAVAMQLMPKNMIVNAVSLVIVAGALTILTDVVAKMSELSWDEIARGLVTLGGALLIISVAMMAMSGAIGGAIALTIVAGALNLIVPVLQALSEMSIGEIATALGALAATFAVLGIAALVLAPITPILLALGAAILLIGVGLGLAGAGALAFSVALTALAVTGAAAASVIVAFIKGLISLFPFIAVSLGNALVAFANVIAEAGPAILGAMSAVLGAFIGAITENIPKIIDLFITLVRGILEAVSVLVPEIVQTALDLILGFLGALRENVPEIIEEFIQLMVDILDTIADNLDDIMEAGADLIVEFLNGISDNLGDVLDAGGDLIVEFVTGIGEQAEKISQAAFDTLISFLEAIESNIESNIQRIMDAGRGIALGIIDGMTGGLGSKVGEVADKAREVASNALDAAKNFLGIGSPSKEFYKVGSWSAEGMILALSDSIPKVERASGRTGNAALESLRKSLSGVSDLIKDDLSLTPTITPIIDLTEVRRGAASIDSTLSGRVSVSGAYASATQTSSEYQDVLNIQNGSGAESTILGGAVVFNQYNTSPKELSPAEVYRQTSNLLSTTKGALP